MTAIGRLNRELAALGEQPIDLRGGAVEVARRRSELVDRTVRALFRPFEDRGLALAAVGGYGRGELAPGSDVDLLVLHGAGDDQGVAEAFASVLYPLWDAGMTVGHAVRTPAECLQEASLRIDSMTSLLDARFLAGREELLAEASNAVGGAVLRDGEAFVERLNASRGERDRRFGHLSHTLEPDLKEALGGLRDLHLLGWLAAANLGGRLRPRDEEAVARAHDVLFGVRAALHRVSRGRSNRLSAELQAPTAELLGIQPEPGWESRDALMREVFAAGRRVDLATWSALDLVAGTDTRAFESTPGPDRPLASFVAMARTGTPVTHPELDALEDAAAENTFPARSPETLADLLDIVRAGEPAVRGLELLDSLGVLARLLPGWEEVRGRPQRDPYHRFPVDVHLMVTAATAARLVDEPGDDFNARAAAAIHEPAVLLLGALLHDIGKTGHGSHVATGARLAREMLGPLPLDEGTKETIGFLVQHHLLLSDTATRRDLEDEDVVLHVAAQVGREERLALLYLLTMADAEATGPAASTPWRIALIRELVAKVGRAFESGRMTPDRARRLEHAEEAIRSSLACRELEVVDAFLSEMPPAYLLWVDPADAAAHLDLVVPRPSAGEVRMATRSGRAPGTELLAVGLADRPGLLSSVAGALTLSGFTILSAHAFTASGGAALDAFEVRGAFQDVIETQQWARFRETLSDALGGRLSLEERVGRTRGHYRPASANVPVRVRIDDKASDHFTVVEVEGADRLGFLFDLALAFSRLALDVHMAKVATYGPRVVDVFYVTRVTGERITEPDELENLGDALAEAAAAP